MHEKQHSCCYMKWTRSLVGQIPDPAELYGREDFIAHLWCMLEANNVLLLAPRRFGKSGVMRHVLLHPHKGYLPLSFDLEDVDSSEEFVWRVTKELLAHSKTRAFLGGVRRLPGAIGTWVKSTFDEAAFEGAKVKFKAAIREDWGEAAKRLLLEVEKADDTVIFLFDELPAMLDRIIQKQGDEAARDFLAWFRTVRLAQKDVLRRHRFIVAGSVGIDQILKKLGATDRLVDFVRLTVEPLDNETAKGLAADLAATFAIAWDRDLGEKMLKLIGAPVPYFIHIFFAQLGQLPAELRAKLTVADLERLYAERVLGRTCRQYFDHYSTRLRRYGPAREKAAMAILRAVADRCKVSRLVLYDIYAKACGKEASEQGFDDLMADLEYELYLQLHAPTNEFQFLLKVMQDWWRRWYPARATRTEARKDSAL
jgi:uncharacterized protein